MSHSSSLAMDWNQGDSGQGSPRKSAVTLRALTSPLGPQSGMALMRGTAFDPSFKLLLGSLSERVWRMELARPLDLRMAPSELAERLFREARLAECNPSHAQVVGAEANLHCHGMSLHEVLVGTPEEHREMLATFVASRFRLMDRQTLEWDAEGRPVRVLTNLVGIVENGHMVGLWGVQRSASPGKPLSATPRPLAESQAHCMCITDLAGTIMFESPDMERLLGDEVALRKGTLWCDLVHPDDRAGMREAFELNISDGEHASSVAKVRVRRHDGVWLRRAILCRPMTDVPGPALISISVRPLPVEDPLAPKRRRKAVPKSSPRMTTQICALNNILALISGHAQLAGSTGELDADLQRHLAVIVEAVDRASATLDKLVE